MDIGESSSMDINLTNGQLGELIIKKYFLNLPNLNQKCNIFSLDYASNTLGKNKKTDKKYS